MTSADNQVGGDKPGGLGSSAKDQGLLLQEATLPHQRGDPESRCQRARATIRHGSTPRSGLNVAQVLHLRGSPPIWSESCSWPCILSGGEELWVQSAPGALPGAAAGVPGRCRAPEAHSLGFSLLTPSPLTEFWVWSSYQGFSRHQPQAESLLEGICTAKHLKSSSLQAPS